MKKNIKYALLTLVAVFGLASCSNEYEYTAPEAVSGAQVYFPTDNASTFTVTDADGVINVTVGRAEAADAADVKINVEGGADCFTVPTTVQFAAGEKTAVLPISYAGLEYDTPVEFSLTLDSLATTPYGVSSYDFTVMRPAPWKTLGKATYVDDFVTTFFGVANVPYYVTIQENELVPGFYRLVNPYGKAYPYNEDGDYDASTDYFMYIHAENPDQVWTETFHSGMDWNYGEFIFASLAGYYIERGKPENAEAYYGTLKNGEITFPASSMLIAMADYNNGGLYTANSNGAFSVLLPGYVKADYSLEANFAGIFTDKAGATAAVTYVEAGADVESVKAVVMPADVDAAAVADAIAAGELEVADYQVGRIEVPFDAEEMASVNLQVIVAVVVDGEVKNVATTSFEYYGGGANPWNSIGTGYYTDDMLLTLFFDAPAPTYAVEIMENTEKPGLYRLMDPYAEGVYPYSSSDLGVSLAPANKFIEVNATNPAAVYVPTQSVNMNWGYGEMSISSTGWDYLEYYGADYMDAIIKAGYFGTLKDGVIEFPYFQGVDEESGKPYAFQGTITMGENAYDGGLNGEWKIVLPSAAKSVKAKMAARAKNSRTSLKAHKLATAHGVDVKKIMLDSAKKFK